MFKINMVLIKCSKYLLPILIHNLLEKRKAKKYIVNSISIIQQEWIISKKAAKNMIELDEIYPVKIPAVKLLCNWLDLKMKEGEK